MKRVRLAELDCAIHGEGARTVVLLHGFGAPAEDLVPLAWALRPPPDTRFVLPAAPLELGLPFSDARAWWLLDAARIMRGEIDPAEVPVGLAAARGKLLAFLDALGVSPEQTVIGGFSQGSMLAADVVLRTDRPFAGLVILSGALICEGEWSALMPARRGLPVFQTHGHDDPLLPYALALRLRALWEQAGADVTFVSFAGGHEIPAEALAGLQAFLWSRFS